MESMKVSEVQVWLSNQILPGDFYSFGSTIHYPCEQAVQNLSAGTKNYNIFRTTTHVADR
jgi:hypothetical protein